MIATGVNMLGDVHGGAGEQCAELYHDIAARIDAGADPDLAVGAALEAWRAERGRIIPGYGHRFHKPVDLRPPRLMALVREAAEAGTVTGRFAEICAALQAWIGADRGAPIAMNIDGATAVIFCELGFAAPLARGLFCLSRSVGILAHGWELVGQGGRNKRPMPPLFLPRFEPPETER